MKLYYIIFCGYFMCLSSVRSCIEHPRLALEKLHKNSTRTSTVALTCTDTNAAIRHLSILYIDVNIGQIEYSLFSQICTRYLGTLTNVRTILPEASIVSHQLLVIEIIVNLEIPSDRFMDR